MSNGHQTQETQVSDKAHRRRFTAQYKRDVLRQANLCTKPGEIGALLRREGLYSSHLTHWRQDIERRELQALAPKKRGPKPSFDARDQRIAELEREITGLKRRAERAELLVEIQKKVSSILGIPLAGSEEEC